MVTGTVRAESQLVRIAHDHRDGVLIGHDQTDDLVENLLRQIGERRQLPGRNRVGRRGFRDILRRVVAGLGHLQQDVQEGLITGHPVRPGGDVGEGVHRDATERHRHILSRGGGEALVLQIVDVQLPSDVRRQLQQRNILRCSTSQISLGAEGGDLTVQRAEIAGVVGHRALPGDRLVAVLVRGIEVVGMVGILGAGEGAVPCGTTVVGQNHHAQHIFRIDDVVLAIGIGLVVADPHRHPAGDVGALAVADDRELGVRAGRGDIVHDLLGIGHTGVHRILVGTHIRWIGDVHRGIRSRIDVVGRCVHHRIHPVAAVIARQCGRKRVAVRVDQHRRSVRVRTVVTPGHRDRHHVVAFGDRRGQPGIPMFRRRHQTPGCRDNGRHPQSGRRSRGRSNPVPREELTKSHVLIPIPNPTREGGQAPRRAMYMSRKVS